jgi:NTP pyrophosphatase (non-canonical NTP hydrolase)
VERAIWHGERSSEGILRKSQATIEKFFKHGTFPLFVRLEKLFLYQQEFQDLIRDYRQKSRPGESKEVLFNKYVNKLLEESEEVRHEFGNKEKLTEELVDVVKFVVNICLQHDISADEFFESFRKKSEGNKARFLDTDWREQWNRKDERNEDLRSN